MRVYVFLLYFFCFLSLIGCGGGGSTPQDDTNPDPTITTYAYLMAFHVSSEETGTSSGDHMIYLAGSDDGIAWKFIEEFSPVSGSVPDLVFMNGFLYIFHTGTNQLTKVNANFQVVDEQPVSLTSDQDTDGFVDPSMFAENNQLYMFYLPGIIGQDPAGCSEFPCIKEIHSAQAEDASLSAFTQVDGARISMTLDMGGMSDPDIVQLADGTYVLYTSSGSNTWSFTSDSLNGTYISPDGEETRVVSNQGGVPSAIAVNDEVWLYVTSMSGNPGDDDRVERIKRTVIPDGVRQTSIWPSVVKE